MSNGKITIPLGCTGELATFTPEDVNMEASVISIEIGGRQILEAALIYTCPGCGERVSREVDDRIADLAALQGARMILAEVDFDKGLATLDMELDYHSGGGTDQPGV